MQPYIRVIALMCGEFVAGSRLPGQGSQARTDGRGAWSTHIVGAMRTVDPVRHEERRREILEAARRRFARDGLRGASVSGICAEAGISPGHLYHYFESKEAILGAIAQMVMHAATERFGRTMENADAIATLVSDAQQAKARDEHGGNALFLDMVAEAGRNPALAQVLQDHSRAMRHLLAGVLRKGQSQGGLDPSLDAEMAAAVLIGVSDGAKTMAVRDPSLDRARVTDLLRILISRFLMPPMPGQKAQRRGNVR